VALTRAVVLDLDGTLVDSLDDIALALGHALEEAGRPRPPRAAVLGWVGRGARSLVADALGLATDDARVAPVLARYLAIYERDPMPATRWIPGAEAFLDLLRARGVAAVLCTNKPRTIADAVVAGFLGRARFAGVIAAGDVPQLKPHPAPITAALALVGVPANEAWMVGDGPPDALAARAAGVRSAIYLRGYGAPEAIAAAAPEATFEDFAALPSILGIA
jgi:phosphoglycolate phosphatase